MRQNAGSRGHSSITHPEIIPRLWKDFAVFSTIAPGFDARQGAWRTRRTEGTGGSHATATWRHRTRLRGGNDGRPDYLSPVAWRFVGRAVFTPQGLYAGVHHRVGLHGAAQARVRQTRHEGHRPERGSGRESRAMGERHQGVAGPRAEFS